MKPLSGTKAWTWTFMILAMCCNIIYMAGLASLQYGCNYGYAGPALQRSSGHGIAAFGMSSTFANCSTVLRFYWFIFAFVFVALTSVGIAAATSWGLYFARPFLVGMVTLSILLMMIASEAFLGYATTLEDFTDTSIGWWWYLRFRPTVAGAIMAVVWLIFLLLAIGTDWEHNTAYPNDGNPGRASYAKTEPHGSGTASDQAVIGQV